MRPRPAVTVDVREVPPRLVVVAVRPCEHRRVKFCREYRGVFFFDCCGCGRELRVMGARA